MSLPFSIAGVNELLVQGYDGFDRPQHRQLVNLLSDGSSGDDQVIQSSGLPFRTANLTGLLYQQHDVDVLRALNDTGEEATFTDGDGRVYTVRLLDFGARGLTGRWTFSMTLVEIAGPNVLLTPSSLAAVTAIPTPTVTAS